MLAWEKSVLHLIKSGCKKGGVSMLNCKVSYRGGDSDLKLLLFDLNLKPKKIV